MPDHVDAALSSPMGTSPPIAPKRPGLREIWGADLSLQDVPLTRFLCRFVSSIGSRVVTGIEGLEHIGPDRDPFILVSNHSTRFEAALLPTLLIFHRQGKLLHYLADWPMMLVPFVATLYRQSGAIIVGGKSAKVKAFDRLQRRFVPPGSVADRSAAALDRGGSLGIFPEGTMNRHPTQLLKGRRGAARLALRTGVDLVPMGIRYPGRREDRFISDWSRLEVAIGPPIRPTELDDATPGGVHREIMTEIARLCGKSWSADARRTRYDDINQP